MNRKPSAAAVRAADPLPSRDVTDPAACCNVCAQPSDGLGAWRAHDDRDQPLPGPHALVFIGKDHPACIRKMEQHPRLYAEDRADPGTFPQLCGPCRHRDGLACRHPALKANGGPGLKVSLTPAVPAIMCGRGGCRTPLRTALECVGREEKRA